MPEPIQPTNPGATPPTGTPPADPTGTPPATPPATPPEGTVDLKNLSAEQLQQVLENPNLWNLPRVKELRDQAAEAKTLKDAAAAAEQKRLEDNKEFEQLAESRKTDLETAQGQIKTMRIDQALTNKLVPEGVVDLDAALKLVDRAKLTIDDNGVVSGIDEALASLKTDKAYLFNKEGTPPTNPSLGTPSNPTGGTPPTGPAKFKRSQLRDAKFYSENRDEIIKAQQAGLIEDDITPK
jgi:hypothetical protein